MTSPLTRRSFLADRRRRPRRPGVRPRPEPQQKLNIAIIGCGGRGAANLGEVAKSENIVALCDVNEPNARAAAARQHPKAPARSPTSASCSTSAKRVRRRGRQHLRAHPRLRHPAGAAARQARLLREAADPQHLGGPRHPRGRREGQGRHADGHPDPRQRQLPPRRRAGPGRRDRAGAARSTSGSSRAWGLAEPRRPRSGTRTSSTVTERPAEASPVPTGLDWDLWLGPAPERPFNEVYFPGPKWYRWWDFGNGTMSDLGSHWNDLPFWALKLQRPADGRGVRPAAAPGDRPGVDARGLRVRRPRRHAAGRS